MPKREERIFNGIGPLTVNKCEISNDQEIAETLSHQFKKCGPNHVNSLTIKYYTQSIPPSTI